jgi:hypothetical protein
MLISYPCPCEHLGQAEASAQSILTPSPSTCDAIHFVNFISSVEFRPSLCPTYPFAQAEVHPLMNDKLIV